jgi:hypothetical protein
LAVSQEGAAGRLEVEVVGLTRYAGFEAVVALLDGPIGATRIETLEFSRSRQLLAVEGPLGLEDLAVRLTELAGEGLVLVPMTVDPIRGRMRVQASYSPPADEPEGDGLEADFEGALPANR